MVSTCHKDKSLELSSIASQQVKSKNRGKIPDCSEEEWSKIIKEFKESGLTQKEFCKEEGIVITTFQRWYGRLNTDSKVKKVQKQDYKVEKNRNCDLEAITKAAVKFDQAKAIKKFYEGFNKRREIENRKRLREEVSID